MKQVLGIRFSEHGQVQACFYEASEGTSLPPGRGVMVRCEQGPAFGRIVWQRTYVRLTSAQLEALASDAPGAHTVPLDQGEMEHSTLEEAAPETTDNVFSENSAPESPAAAPPASESCPLPKALESRDGIQARLEADDRRKKAQEAEEARRADDDAVRRRQLMVARAATPEELSKAAENEQLCRDAREFCRRCILDRQLEMKLVDVESLFDRSKLIFYFTAPTRIDFRELVKDLVRQYHTRIELRQIGVRHETQMLGALGNCGMVCCCRRYLRHFAPVTIKMAKEQNLFLNPAKISGICGRLLCCLSYEQANYDAFHRSCPKLGKRYQTEQGPMRVLRGNMFRNSVVLLPDGGQEIEMTLEEWQELHPHRTEHSSPPQPKENRQGTEFMVVRASPDTLDADLAELEQNLDDSALDMGFAHSAARPDGQGASPGKFNKKRKRRPDGQGDRPGPRPRQIPEGQE